MASTRPQRPKSYTPPKGESTQSQAELERERRMLTARQANLQWAAVIVVGIVILGLVFVFGSGTGGNYDGIPVGGHG